MPRTHVSDTHLTLQEMQFDSLQKDAKDAYLEIVTSQLDEDDGTEKSVGFHAFAEFALTQGNIHVLTVSNFAPSSVVT